MPATMKQLTWKLVMPLTVMSFAVFTEWWYVLIVDAPDTMMIGFPFPYACDAWYTSLALQIFVSELLIDLLVYFLFWFVIVFCIDRFLIKIKVPRIALILLFSFAGLFTTGLV